MDKNYRGSLLLVFYLIVNVFAYDLKFGNCGTNGWTCVNNTVGQIDVTYDCPQELQGNKSPISWEFQGLPVSTQSLTIQNCNGILTIGVKTESVAPGKYPVLTSFIVRNVAELVIKENTFSIPNLLKGQTAVKFENIKLIKSLIQNSIGGTLLMSMESFLFEMKNVHIKNIQERAIWWFEGEVPFKMIWNNVTVETVEENAFHIADTKRNPNAQVFIRNCKFGLLKTKSFNVHSTDFLFMDNEMDNVQKSVFRITSNNITFSRNEFFHIDNFAFLYVNIDADKMSFKFESNTIHHADKLSMNFGAPNYGEIKQQVTFRDNKFDCLNSTWLQRSEEEKIVTKGGEEEETQYVKYLKKFENNALNNNGNVCADLPCSITISNFKNFYLKNGSAKNICQM